VSKFSVIGSGRREGGLVKSLSKSLGLRIEKLGTQGIGFINITR
jgi:hypothetical protein